MKILVIENREKTLFWNVVFSDPIFRNCQLCWLVQNPLFHKDLKGEVYNIDFPKKSDLECPDNDSDLVTDRGRDYFLAGDLHYRYYDRRILDVLEICKPDIVVGECTLIQELIAIKLCQRLDIPFVHPVSERYPQRRFAVFKDDTQRPAAYSNDIMDRIASLELASRIATNTEVLNYLPAAQKCARATKKLRWMLTRFWVVVGRLRGEKYNTPSILRKWQLARNRTNNLVRWDTNATVPLANEVSILYPLQMQPENTIDVWGRGFHNQVDILRAILSNCESSVTVSVKANPKPYYEVGDELIDFCLSNPRVRLLPRKMNMTDAMEVTVGALTITGTVGFEAACGRGRCLSLLHPILSDEFPSLAANDIAEGVRKLLSDPKAGRGSVATGARLMEALTARSFSGYISDPVSDPLCMEPGNVAMVACGLKAALDKVSSQKADAAAAVR